MFEEVGIGFVGDAAIGFVRRPHCMGWEGLPGRGAWWRIVPEPAVLEDFADFLDSVALMGWSEWRQFRSTLVSMGRKTGPVSAKATVFRLRF